MGTTLRKSKSRVLFKISMCSHKSWEAIKLTLILHNPKQRAFDPLL